MIYRILTIVLIISATFAYTFYQKKSLESNLVTDNSSDTVLSRLPSVDFETLNGEKFNLDQFFNLESPHLTVVHFWGTWCAPCEAELPELMSLVKKYEGMPKVHFLLVAVNDEVVKIKKHLKDKNFVAGPTLHWLLDNKNFYRDIFGTTRVPETYVFSSDKTSLRKFIGPQNWSKSSFSQVFEELLQISTRKL